MLIIIMIIIHANFSGAFQGLRGRLAKQSGKGTLSHRTSELGGAGGCGSTPSRQPQESQDYVKKNKNKESEFKLNFSDLHLFLNTDLLM